MGIMDIFKRSKPSEESIELPVDEEPTEQIVIRVDTLGGLVDIDRIEKLMREGNIIFLKVKELQTKDLGEFKNAVEKLKRRCLQYGWDIVAISDGYLLMTPQYAKIVR